MTREEIEKDRQYQLTGTAIDYCRKEHPHYDGEALGEITDAFEEGAEWEHKRLNEKAYEWLENNFVCFLQGAKRGIYSNQFITVNEMIDNFKRTMEE
jgi:hypothetical protein